MIKGRGRGWRTFILHLAPARLSGRYNVCPASTPACRDSCLYYSGRGVFPAVKAARIAKTRRYFEDRPGFLVDLFDDLDYVHRCQRRGQRVAVRLNGTSDIRWELDGVMRAYPDLQFYDYTKLTNRTVPDNYHLTYSVSEEAGSILHAHQTLKSVAVIFRHDRALPKWWWDLPVIDGDADDLRFLDPPRVVVGLRAKGPARRGLPLHVFDGVADRRA